MPVVVQAGLIVNEVLSNEPGTSITLEWFEFFNNGSTSQNLSFFQIQVGANVLTLDTAGGPYVVRTNDYMVICRNLFSDTVSPGNISPGFESVWGDNSGVWGDDLFLENYAIVEAPFNLPKASGSVSVTGGVPSIDSSQIIWNSAGLDGVSWERLSPTSDSIVQSVETGGSTPGRVNSLTPVPLDLALDTVSGSIDNGSTLLIFSILNSGVSLVSGASVDLFYGRDKLYPIDSLITTILLPDIDSGFITLVTEKMLLSEMYRPMSARLSDDDRLSNNRLLFVAPGDGYPPAEITEFLADPSSPFNTEWIEIHNRQDTVIELSGWLIGNAIGLNIITPTMLFLDPGEYLVLAENSIQFFADYPDFSGDVVEPTGWSTFDNNSDQVRLVDLFGIQADSFSYSSTFGGNKTWSKDEADTTRVVWGKSSEIGGSPGKANKVRLLQMGSTLTIQITPKIFTPDGNGIDDEVSIVVNAPTARSFKIKIYDRKARVVRTLEDGSADLASEYRWDGRSDAGRLQPVGIYILYVEASGVESRKQTIVIAR